MADTQEHLPVTLTHKQWNAHRRRDGHSYVDVMYRFDLGENVTEAEARAEAKNRIALWMNVHAEGLCE